MGYFTIFSIDLKHHFRIKSKGDRKMEGGKHVPSPSCKTTDASIVRMISSSNKAYRRTTTIARQLPRTIRPFRRDMRTLTTTPKSTTRHRGDECSRHPPAEGPLRSMRIASLQFLGTGNSGQVSRSLPGRLGEAREG